MESFVSQGTHVIIIRTSKVRQRLLITLTQPVCAAPQRTRTPLTRSDSGNSDDNYVPILWEINCNRKGCDRSFEAICNKSSYLTKVPE